MKKWIRVLAVIGVGGYIIWYAVSNIKNNEKNSVMLFTGPQGSPNGIKGPSGPPPR